MHPLSCGAKQSVMTRGRRTTVERLSRDRLQVSELHRLGLLKATASPPSRLAWCSTIDALQADQAWVLLKLFGRSAPQRVRVTWTRCRFGGMRPWLHCPHCQSRRAILLHGVGGYFCRDCLGRPPYASQTKSTGARPHWSAAKLRLRLGMNASLHDKPLRRPKGMHWKTYDKLRQKLHGLERRISSRMRTREPDYKDLIAYMPGEISK